MVTCLVIQGFSQLSKGYGCDQTDVIMNITANIISEQINGGTSKQISEWLGKIIQDRERISINSADISISRSR
ncbi:TraM recognition domain-containing protein [Flavobacterium notoginsengisoli]|uniref:TraM recognition domain-containing protein n=1 Tax=Flavobacterium notoginsengisoli TaxID=1478199 RepID=UPI003633248B